MYSPCVFFPLLLNIPAAFPELHDHWPSVCLGLLLSSSFFHLGSSQAEGIKYSWTSISYSTPSKQREGFGSSYSVFHKVLPSVIIPIVESDGFTKSYEKDCLRIGWSFYMSKYCLSKISSMWRKRSQSLHTKFTTGYSPGDICLPSTYTTISGERGRGKSNWSIYTLKYFCSSIFHFFSSVLLCTGPLSLGGPGWNVCIHIHGSYHLGFGFRVAQECSEFNKEGKDTMSVKVM